MLWNTLKYRWRTIAALGAAAALISVSVRLAIEWPSPEQAAEQAATVNWPQAIAILANLVTIVGVILFAIELLKYLYQRLPEARVQEAIRDLCDEVNPARQHKARMTLLKLHEHSLKPLKELADGLASSGSYRLPMAMLVIIARQSDDPEVRAEAARIVGRQRYDRSFDHMVDLLEPGARDSPGTICWHFMQGTCSHNQTPLDWALPRPDSSNFNSLSDAIIRAATQGDADAPEETSVRTLCQSICRREGSHWLSLDPSERRPGGFPGLVKRLLAGGANPNEQDGEGRSALRLAILRDDFNSVKALLEAGAEPNERDAEGAPDLHLAIRRNDINIVRALLDAGADPRATNADGVSALELSETLDASDAIRHDLAQLVSEYAETGQSES